MPRKPMTLTLMVTDRQRAAFERFAADRDLTAEEALEEAMGIFVKILIFGDRRYMIANPHESGAEANDE